MDIAGNSNMRLGFAGIHASHFLVLERSEEALSHSIIPELSLRLMPGTNPSAVIVARKNTFMADNVSAGPQRPDQVRTTISSADDGMDGAQVRSELRVRIPVWC